MATAQAQPRPAPRLYLAIAPLADPAALAQTLPAAIGAANVAAVLVRQASVDERTLINAVKALAPPLQAQGIAVLVEGDPAVAARAGADGAHLIGPEAFQAAVSRLKPDRIAGAGGLHSRDDAMVAGEAGADYVMFGEPEVDGHRPSFTAIVERVAWWSELFEIPCVAWAERFEEIGDLCTAGADFIAIGDALLADPRGIAAALADVSSRMTAPPA
jgi:thiamine-phosphate pyrophosphorylase